MNYDLKAIVIHRGGAYGGHYHAYLRDDLKEGVWNLKLPEKYATEPTKLEDKKDQDKKKGEEEKQSAAAGATEDKKEEEETKKEELINEKDIDWKSMSKTERKAMSKKLKAQKQSQNQNKKPQQQSKKSKKKEEKMMLDMDYS